MEQTDSSLAGGTDFLNFTARSGWTRVGVEVGLTLRLLVAGIIEGLLGMEELTELNEN